jgi:hypothetical protein
LRPLIHHAKIFQLQGKLTDRSEKVRQVFGKRIQVKSAMIFVPSSHNQTPGRSEGKDDSGAARVPSAALCRSAIILSVALLLMMVSSTALPAALAGGVGEYQVKAAFLFNFMKFVEWPNRLFTTANGPLIIGVPAVDSLQPTLEKIFQGKTVRGRSVVVRELKNKEQAAECHVLFLTGLDKRQMDAWLERLKGSPTLTVGESENFAARGGIINFFLLDNQVRFEINPGAAEKAGLKISSQLLSLAKIIESPQ